MEFLRMVLNTIVTGLWIPIGSIWALLMILWRTITGQPLL